MTDNLLNSAFDEALDRTECFDMHYKHVEDSFNEQFVCRCCEQLAHVKVQDDSFDYPTGYGRGYATENSYSVSTECCQDEEFYEVEDLFNEFLGLAWENMDDEDLNIADIEEECREWYNNKIEVA